MLMNSLFSLIGKARIAAIFSLKRVDICLNNDDT